MRIIILGTGDAFTRRGFGTSAVIEGRRGTVLLDCPDLIHRVLNEAGHATGRELDASRIDDIILTHLHGDHCNGLESFGFFRFVHRLQGRKSVIPRLHTHPKAAARVWERLAPAMDAPLTPGADPAELSDFFQLAVFEPGSRHAVAGLTIESRYTVHPVPTIGLRISDGSQTLAWSGDTAFDQDHVDWLAEADLIVHEANLGPAHTHIEQLNALPDHLRRKMRLTHLVDDFDPSTTDIQPLRAFEVIEL